MELETQLETQIEDQKRKSTVINNLAIDWKYLLELAPQIFNQNPSNSPQLLPYCNALHSLCDRSIIAIRELKTLIPNILEKTE